MNYGKRVETMVSDFPVVSVYIIINKFLIIEFGLSPKLTGGVFVKKSAHAIILLMVFPLIVTGCATKQPCTEVQGLTLRLEVAGFG